MASNTNVSDEVVLAYIDAKAALYQVCCCADDKEVDVEFIEERLKTAMLAVTFFMLKGDGYDAPRSSKDRVSALRKIYGSSFVPRDCALFAWGEYSDDRKSLVHLGQVMDAWISITFPRYSDLISRVNNCRSLRSYAC